MLAASLLHVVAKVALWIFLLGLLVSGIVFLVLAVIRWDKPAWKWSVLALILVFPLAAAVGWVALVAGGVRSARDAEAADMPPPPTGPPSA